MSLITGTNFPELQIHYDFRSGEPRQPYTVKSKLGCDFLNGKSVAPNLNSNNINKSFNLENFWNVESYGTDGKKHFIMLTN